jgi:integrase
MSSELRDRELVRRLRHALAEHERVARMKRPSDSRRAHADTALAELRGELGRRLVDGTFDAWDALGIAAMPGDDDRRVQGAGSLYEDKARGRWVAELTVDGKRSRTIHRDRDAAEDWLREARQRIERGQSARASSTTVGEWLTARLDVWSMELRPSTIANHRAAVERWWLPSIGHVRLLALRQTDVEHVVKAMVSAGLSANSVRINTAPLIKALNEAVKDAHLGLTVNVAAHATKPKITSTESEYLTPDEARRVIAEATDAYHGDAIVTAMLLGLRRGELLGLAWDRVELDADRPTVTINRQLIRGDDGPVLESTTKTGDKGMRVVVLPPMAVDVLRRRRQRQRAERLAAGSAWRHEHNLVFTTATGSAVDPDALTKAVYRLTRKAIGRQVSAHALRHTAATLLHDAGVSMKVAQAILGHTTESMTSRVYTHTMDHQLDQAAALLNDLLSS